MSNSLPRSADRSISDMIPARANLYQSIRNFFSSRDVCEVDVPVLGQCGVTDPNIDCIEVPGGGYLQSSPEYFMKRLLVEGSGDIYSLGKAFRGHESGRRHNLEFTMLEWYRLGFDLQALIDEVIELCVQILDTQSPSAQISDIQNTDGQLVVTQWTYRECFQKALNIDPHTLNVAELRSLSIEKGASDWPDDDRDFWLDWLLTHCVEPSLPEGLVVITDYPASQAALARIAIDDFGIEVGKRFEVYYQRTELANGYWELGDSIELRQRFEKDQNVRSQREQPPMCIDEPFLAAMEKGMPECCGVALGVDRLLMLQQGTDDIREVLAFPFSS